MKFKTFISIDDTDELGYEKSTGMIADEIKEYIEENFEKCSYVSRHQLFLDERINYTSHNSSMCFTSFLTLKDKEKVIDFIENYLKQQSAPSAQPGLAIVFEKDIKDKKNLIEYGKSAKRSVLSKDDAYTMAKKQGIYLNEYKNEGNGVIGALAGIALRVYGSDGKLKGKFKIEENILSVKSLKGFDFVDEVRDENRESLFDNEEVYINGFLKPVLLDNKAVVLIKKEKNINQSLTIEELREY